MSADLYPRAVFAVDVETTGLGEEASLLEIGLAVVDVDGAPVRPQRHVPFRSSLVRHDGPIPPAVRAVHHISPAMVGPQSMAEAPNKAWSKVRAHHCHPDLFVGSGDVVLCAHNAALERRFIEPLEAAQPSPAAIQWIDTYKLGLRLSPEAERHTNGALFYHLGLFERDTLWPVFVDRYSLHRAGPDAAITAAIAAHYLKQISIDEAVAISAQPALLPRVPFGQNRGSPWSEMDAGFLRWVLDRDFSEDVLFTAAQHLKVLEDGE